MTSGPAVSTLVVKPLGGIRAAESSKPTELESPGLIMLGSPLGVSAGGCSGKEQGNAGPECLMLEGSPWLGVVQVGVLPSFTLGLQAKVLRRDRLGSAKSSAIRERKRLVRHQVNVRLPHGAEPESPSSTSIRSMVSRVLKFTSPVESDRFRRGWLVFRDAQRR